MSRSSISQASPKLEGLVLQCEERFKSVTEDQKMLLAVWIASLMVTWQASVLCNNSTAYECTGMLALGVSAGAVSCGLILIYVICDNFTGLITDTYAKCFQMFLAMWWISWWISLTMPINATCAADPYCQV